MSKTILLNVGMAGSGKSSFSQRLYSWLSKKDFKIDPNSGLNQNVFSINLDPATLTTRMPCNEDIRDVIDYSKVMQDYNLGPNGAIITCLNLYLLKIDSLIEKIESSEAKYVIIDTPGQIEAFTWSSPGFVLVDTLKKLYKENVKIVYLIDSAESQKQEVFISNMVYASSLSCRYDLDVICAFNKCDLVDTKILMSWLDYEVFRMSLDDNEMYSPMLGSLALYFEEFYNILKVCCVSAATGFGEKEFFEKIEEINLDNLKIE